MRDKLTPLINTVVMIAICAAMLFMMSTTVIDTWSAGARPQLVTIEATEQQTEVQQGIDHEPWDVLKSKYKDTVGYIKVDGTTIDEVVVQGVDNKYYLRKSPVGDENEYYHAGCYFVDCRCAVDLCQNTIIYGHNLMDETTRFGQLEKYRKLVFYKQNPVIYFDTPSSVGKWKIVAVFMTNNNENDGEIFYYRDRGYVTQEAFLTYIDRCRVRSLIDCPVDVQENDRILTLSTCDYTLSDARFVVIARKVRDGEDDTVDVSKAKLNDNPLYPEGYYKKYGGEMPDEQALIDELKSAE